MKVTWAVRSFDQLGVEELHDLLKLRVDVFVVEQQCIYPELDGKDASAVHVLGKDATGSLLAYARILPPEDDEAPHIGRVVVHPSARSKGLGLEVMRIALQATVDHFGTDRSIVAAQSHLERFYERLGYVRQGPDYDWDGIAHVDMLRQPDAKPK